VSVGHKREPYKTTEPIEMPFGTRTRGTLAVGYIRCDANLHEKGHFGGHTWARADLHGRYSQTDMYLVGGGSSDAASEQLVGCVLVIKIVHTSSDVTTD